jgi:filamentous hemagglutinin family protein
VLVGILLYTASGLSVSHADVTSSGLGTTVNQGAPGVFNITGGSRPGGGTNLFHSFGNFSLNTAESANFLNNSGLATKNILSRVTGGNPSTIFGTINTLNFPGANLFLMNPAGVVFGPTAQLNVGGSFHVTTADYIKLGTDGIFYADPARPTVLSVAPPSAFGFLTANPAPIEVQTGGINFDTFLPALLQVPEGQTLSLVGGNAAGSDVFGVSIGARDGSTPGYLLAPAGRVNLVSVASAGEAAFDGRGFNVDGFARLGGVKVGSGSIVDGKEIFIRGGRLVIDNGVVAPGAFAFELSLLEGFSPLPDGGQVNIKVTDDVSITGTERELLTFAPPGIFVYTGDPLGNSISPAAKVPDVNIEAGSVSISGLAGIHAQRNAPGEPGSVVINANKVTIGNGGSIVLLNTFEGPGLNLTINAKEVDVSGDGSPSAFAFEGIAVQGLRHVAYLVDLGAGPITDPALITADSGNITINASDSLSVRGLGQITTDSRNFGRAGDITIKAGNVLVAGTGDPQSALIGSQSVFAGDSGNIAINATGTITVTGGARITSTSLGSGNAGSVTLTASGPITLSGADARVVGATFQPPDSQLNDLFNEMFFQDFDSIRAEMGKPNATMMEVLAYLQGRGDILIPNLDLTPGDAGTVSVTTPVLTLNAGTRIETSTGWEGNAGSVLGNVGSLFVKDGAAIRSRSGVVFLDGTSAVGPGHGGSVTFTADDTISISGSNSIISTTTFGDGNAGTISLSANQVTISGPGSGLFSETGPGRGAGGDINVTSPQIQLLNGGIISANSTGTVDALAGSVKIVTNDLTMNDGSITTKSLLADGGNITLTTTGSLVHLTNSQITTSVESGVGTGGNIAVNSSLIVLDDSKIQANAFGGPGGNINITADVFLVNQGGTTPGSLVGIVEASSALSTPGRIIIQATITDVSGTLARLPESVLQAAALLTASCATRLAGGKTSSLVVAGREGVPPTPDAPLWSPLTDVGVDAPLRSGEGHGRDSFPKIAVIRLPSRCAN